MKLTSLELCKVEEFELDNEDSMIAAKGDL